MTDEADCSDVIVQSEMRIGPIALELFISDRKIEHRTIVLDSITHEFTQVHRTGTETA